MLVCGEAGERLKPAAARPFVRRHAMAAGSVQTASETIQDAAQFAEHAERITNNALTAEMLELYDACTCASIRSAQTQTTSYSPMTAASRAAQRYLGRKSGRSEADL